MPQYFFKFPKMFSRNIVSTDLTTRIKIRDKYLDNEDLYYKYDVQDSDTAEILASKYYGSSELHWIILITNNIFDKDFDLPMPYGVFRRYIEDKYKNNYGVQKLTVLNAGFGYADGEYKNVPLTIKNETDLERIGKKLLVNLSVSSGIIYEDIEIARGGSGYDANTIFTVDNSYLGGIGSGAEFKILRFMNALEYSQTTTDETFGFQKEIRIIDTGSINYEIDTFGNAFVTSIPSSVISRTIHTISETEYYTLYEGTSPHPAQLFELGNGQQVLYDVIRIPPVSIYQNELNVNNRKRQIRILKKEYFPQALKEFISLMAETYG